MPEPAAPFAVDPGTAVHALVLAESAARNVLDLRADPPAGNLHLALFLAPAGEAAELDASDARAVVDYMDGLLVAEHGSPGTSEVYESVGFSARDICRIKAFECVRAGVDAYAAIIERRKFDGATCGYGSHRFEQILPGGGSTPMISAGSGWRGDQDYLAAMMVPATLRSILLEYGVLPRELVASATFLLTGGAWTYPDS
jgi:hypothetical protein